MKRMPIPMNAYELTRYIEQGEIDKVLKISKPAVYKSCKRLSVNGYLEGETVQEGDFPKKVIYSVTESGKKHFFELMVHLSTDLKPFYHEFNSFLWNIEKLEKSKGLKMLENLRNQLSTAKNWSIKHENEIKPFAQFSARIIAKQYRMVMSTLLTWIDETIVEFIERD